MQEAVATQQTMYRIRPEVYLPALRSLVRNYPLEKPLARDHNIHPKRETFPPEHRVRWCYNDPQPMQVHGTKVFPLWQMDETLTSHWTVFTNLLMALEPALISCAWQAKHNFPMQYEAAMKKYEELTTTVPASTLIPPFWIDPATYCFSAVRLSVNLACEAHTLGETDGVPNFAVATWMGSEEVDEQGVTLVFPDFQDGWRTTGNRSCGIAPVIPGHRVGAEPYHGEWYVLEFYLPNLEGDELRGGKMNVEGETNSGTVTVVLGIMGEDSAVVLNGETNSEVRFEDAVVLA